MIENKRLFVGRKKVEDRFTIILDYDDEIGVKENRSGDVIVLKHNDLNAQQFVAQLVVFLNDQNQAIVDLYDGCKYWSDKASERITLLEKENEKLKNALKNSYLNEICENCEYGHYFRSYNYGGLEGDFECKKGHDGADCDGLKDCDDFELRY